MNTRYFYPPIPDRSAPKAVPLFGYYTKMLVEGYGWKGAIDMDLVGVYDFKEDGSPIYTKKSPYAVDLATSNVRTHSKIVCKMRQSYWSLRQVEEALLNPINLGGGYYRASFAASPSRAEKFLIDRYEGSYTAYELDQYHQSRRGAKDQPPTTPPRGGSSRRLKNTWNEVDGFHFQIESTIRVIAFLAKTGPATSNEVQRSGAISGRAAARYVSALASVGIVSETHEKWLTKDGRYRPAKVVRLASVETAEAVLATRGIEDNVRTLWETLLTFRRAVDGDPVRTAELERLLEGII